MKKKTETRELNYQPIGRVAGGWISRASEFNRLQQIRNLVLALTVAGCVIIDAVIVSMMF